jgi:hypothetical protein
MEISRGKGKKFKVNKIKGLLDISHFDPFKPIKRKSFAYVFSTTVPNKILSLLDTVTPFLFPVSMNKIHATNLTSIAPSVPLHEHF